MKRTLILSGVPTPVGACELFIVWMRRAGATPLGFVALAAAIWLCAAAVCGARAEAVSAAELQKIEEARGALDRVEKRQEEEQSSFDGLLALRDSLSPTRDELRDLTGVLQQRLSAAQARLSELGPAPAAGAPAEAAAVAAQRKAMQGLVNEIDSYHRTARALQVQADQLWDDLTDDRRDLFNTRIFERHSSFVNPAFWRDVFRESLPDFKSRAGRELTKLHDGVEVRKGWPRLLALGAIATAFTGLLGAAHAWLARRRRSLPARQAPAQAHSKTDLVIHAAIVFAMRAVPFVAVAALMWVSVTNWDLAPDEVDSFLEGVAGSLAVLGVGVAAGSAAFSPTAPEYRIVETTDSGARLASRVLNVTLAIYVVGLTVLGAINMVSAHVAMTMTVTGLTALAVLAAGGTLLAFAPAAPAEEPAHGVFKAPLELLRPILWLIASTVVVALLFGFIAFAGFIVGRALATAVILCLAILTYAAIDTIFYDAIAPGTRANRRIALLFGLKPTTVDLLGTIVAGALRVATVVLTVLVLFSPWGIEFGQIDPFDDVLFGLRISDLRGWFGAAGVAIAVFTVGLVATRLFVSWLNRQLLPRTAWNPGVRHSLTTVAGYAGFVGALALALVQAGVQIQNVTLVAGALSVGVGFGLQQVVSNFVAGLIVLAERPIRVGDTVVVKGEEGEVRNISVRATEILLAENSTIIVPNSDIISSTVKNRTFIDPEHRVTVRFVLSHDADLALCFEKLRAIAEAHPHLVSSRPARVLIKSVSEVGIEVETTAMCDAVSNMATTRSDLYYQAIAAFRACGVDLARGAPSAPPAPAVVDA